MEIEALQLKAERLHRLRALISQKEEELQKALEPIKDERNAIQEELLADMAATNLATIKLATGENYIRSIRKGVQVTDPFSALRWAREHNAISIDSKLVAQQLKDATELPAGFARVETAYISIRNPKKND